jgi:hypothetical protein
MKEKELLAGQNSKRNTRHARIPTVVLIWTHHPAHVNKAPTRPHKQLCRHQLVSASLELN